MRRKELKALSIGQDNDASCFNSRANNQNGSRHTKRAKRLASKRVRQLLKIETSKEGLTCDV